jgi:hypothetical protein
VCLERSQSVDDGVTGGNIDRLRVDLGAAE